MPLLQIAPSLETKLSALTQAARHDLSCACGSAEPRKRGPDGLWIYPTSLPGGQRVPILKVLQATGCERGCLYCVERLGGRSSPVAIQPDDLARAFIDMHRQGKVVGIFLSSAIRQGAVATMDRMLATADLLRGQYRFRGFIHLKIIPGSTPSQVERAMALATRVSVNLEAPTAVHLKQIAPSKRFNEELLAPMRQIAKAEAAGQFTRSGQTTQLVVGAAGESDRQITSMAAWLYHDVKLARVYYSALQPIPGTALADRAPIPLMREHRLYQVDFLLRSYGFTLGEIEFDSSGALPLNLDPKSAWARRHPEHFPIEVNTAPASQLLRIPGVGPKSAKRITQQRRQERLRSIDALGALGVSCKVAAPFVLLDGKPGVRQMSLF